MPRLAGVVCLVLLAVAAATRAVPLSLTTTPAGAQVWTSPEHDPAIRYAGTSPLTVEVPEGKRLQIICRAPGYYPAFRWVEAGAAPDPIALTPFPTDLNDLVTIGQRRGRPGPWIGPYGRPDQARQVAAGAMPQEQWDEFAWSPDGRWVAWHRAALITTQAGYHEYVMRLMLLDPRTLERRELGRRQVGEGDYHFDYAWTADGEFLLFTRPGGPGISHERIFVYEPATGRERLLVSDPAASCYFPAPLGDGQVAYVCIPDGVRGGESEVWVCDWDGGDRRRIGAGHFGDLPIALVSGDVLWSGRRGMELWAGEDTRIILPRERWRSFMDFLVSPDGTCLSFNDSVYRSSWDLEGNQSPPKDLDKQAPRSYLWSRTAGLRQVPGELHRSWWLPDSASFLALRGSRVARLDLEGRTISETEAATPKPLNGPLAPLPRSALKP